VSSRTLGPLLAVFVLALAALGLGLGTLWIPPDRVWATLWGQGTERELFLLAHLRGPRVAGALAAGALLAWAGLVLQGLYRNPLVSPDLLGIQAGASAAVVVGMVWGVASPWVGPLAFAGAVAAALTIGLLGGRSEGGSRLLLGGLGINALLMALVTLLLLQANVYQAAQAYQWMVGSLYSTTADEALFLVVSALGWGGAAFFLVPGLRLLQVGDQGAQSLGAPVGLWRSLLTVLAAGLASSAVAVVGPLGFVALAVPHAARLLFGPVGPATFVFTGLLGAGVLLAVDLAGQHLVPGGLPAGVLAAGLGGPYFLFLLRKRGPIL